MCWRTRRLLLALMPHCRAMVSDDSHMALVPSFSAALVSLNMLPRMVKATLRSCGFSFPVVSLASAVISR